MIGTLSMITLVALGIFSVNPVVILPFAVGNAAVGLSVPSATEAEAAGGPSAAYWRAYGEAFKGQILFTTLGYAMGFAAARLVELVG